MKNASMGNDMSALLLFVAKLTIFNIKHKIEEQVPHHTKNQNALDFAIKNQNALDFAIQKKKSKRITFCDKNLPVFCC